MNLQFSILPSLILRYIIFFFHKASPDIMIMSILFYMLLNYKVEGKLLGSCHQRGWGCKLKLNFRVSIQLLLSDQLKKNIQKKINKIQMQQVSKPCKILLQQPKTYEIHLTDSLYIVFYTSDRGKPYPSSLYIRLISCSIYDNI